MRATDAVSIDLIQELRLRKWAREHYVVAAQRGRHWHPIVLEEMQFRDEELRAAQASRNLLCSPYVPLDPGETYYLDEPHDAVPEPKSLPALTGAEVSGGTGIPVRAQLLGGTDIPVCAVTSPLSARRIRQ